jgi:hypothetical protein
MPPLTSDYKDARDQCGMLFAHRKSRGEIMEVLEERCDECGRPPRRLSLIIDGLLFCQRDCYLAYHARIWEQLITSNYSHPKESKPDRAKPQVSVDENRTLRVL